MNCYSIMLWLNSILRSDSEHAHDDQVKILNAEVSLVHIIGLIRTNTTPDTLPPNESSQLLVLQSKPPLKVIIIIVFEKINTIFKPMTLT